MINFPMIYTWYDKSNYELTKDTPYLTLSGKLWRIFCEYFEEKWLCYIEFWVYQVNHVSKGSQWSESVNDLAWSGTDAKCKFYVAFGP